MGLSGYFDKVGSDNFNAEEIAEEAKHLEDTLAKMREQISILENDGFSYRIVDIYDENDIEEYRTDKFRHDARRRDIAILKNALGTPYFARMKLKPCDSAPLDDRPSMTRARKFAAALGTPDEETDIYVGANVIFYKDKIIVYSHNSPLGNRVYDRFDSGFIEHDGYRYEVIFRRKFDIREGKLVAVFQDYSKESGGVVYDKFLAHMLEVKRGDKRLTDIIPTIQANQNAIITRPADESSVVRGCAGCGKTMILLQRLEYLGFNKKADLENALVIAPGSRYIEHIEPVVQDLMIGAARRITMSELYKELLLSLGGIKSAERKRIADGAPVGDDTLSDGAAIRVYGDEVKHKLISALSPVKKSYQERMALYREQLERYERDAVFDVGAVKPRPPVVSISLDRFGFLPNIGVAFTKAKLYLLLTAYCYILGKPRFDSALFIDEGQDYCYNEYKLLSEITKSTVNIYGDENQQLVKGRGIDDFDRLSSLFRDLKFYSLNENYRNSREITGYVNNLLGMEVTSLGLEGGTVEETDFESLPDRIKKSDARGDRVAVIYSADDEQTERALMSFVPEGMLYTVTQAKGMEYETVFACGALSEREKYVAYTRALAELYIVR